MMWETDFEFEDKSHTLLVMTWKDDHENKYKIGVTCFTNGKMDSTSSSHSMSFEELAVLADPQFYLTVVAEVVANNVLWKMAKEVHGLPHLGTQGMTPEFLLKNVERYARFSLIEQRIKNELEIEPYKESEDGRPD